MASRHLTRRLVEVVIAVAMVASYVSVPFLVLPNLCSRPQEAFAWPQYRFVVEGQQSQTSGQVSNQRLAKQSLSVPQVQIKARGTAQPVIVPTMHNYEWERKFWCETSASDFAVGLFTLLLGIATYFLWVATERLAVGGDEQAKKMLEGIKATLAVAERTKEVSDAMEEAASAMRQAAGISEATLLQTKKDSQRELRAYISVEPAAINSLIRSREARGQVTIRNVGKIPAHGVAAFVHMFMSGEDSPSISKCEGDDVTVKRTIQPGTEMRRGSNEALPISELINPGKNAFVWGVVYYDNGYGERCITRFCHKYPTASFNRLVNWIAMYEETKIVIAKEKARFHHTGNDAN